MPRKIILSLSAFIFCFAYGLHASAQTDDHKFEIGGQFSVLNATNGRGSVTTPVPCSPAPCLITTTTTTTDGRATEPGFGARIGYNFNRYFALEAEGNFFPRERDLGDNNFNGGRKTQGLFGAKIGRRYEQYGLFAKVRPGFVHFEQGSFGPRDNTICAAVFPQPAACFEPRGRTDFAFDVGGILELYPSSRTIVRFDAGDTILRTDRHGVPINVPNRGPVIGSAGNDTTHNFQGSIGIGYRF